MTSKSRRMQGGVLLVFSITFLISMFLGQGPLRYGFLGVCALLLAVDLALIVQEKRRVRRSQM